jgi:phospholipid-binding lipoprotein MlaA
MHVRRPGPPLLAAGALVLALALPGRPALAEADPLEGVNRRVHAFNDLARRWVLAPLAEAYRATTTPRIRHGIANAFANLNEPLTLASSLAAGETGLAWNAAARFGINTTLGLGGLRDRALAMGYPRHPLTPGDALCHWGVPSGPFLVLPLLGPSTLRDAGALAATSATLSQALGSDLFLAWSTGDALVGYDALHDALARIEAESLDPYAVYRSAFRQRRAASCPADRAEAAAAEAEEPGVP